MFGPNWETLSNGLAVRVDDFSWQGSFREDPRFFLRRDKSQPDRITDCLFGEVPDDQAAMLLAEFISYSGLPASSRLTFSRISDIHAAHEETVSKHDRTAKVARLALESLGIPVVTFYLEQSNLYWDTVLLLGTTTNIN
ncbi:hypothetical protein [Salipiger thiooxidans]|uniref:hypothetical protein n=1 Tax=Salipiger thiooxidans TaxID=282683 RepID=UPI0010426069|nr:hypothetical protein [Salipiger thiooxidans]